jgi:Tfp pilus assembly protein PilX
MQANKLVVRQHGVVLPLALVMLVMVTLIAVVALRGVTSEERISANLRSSSVAFEQAELALRHCEQIALTGGDPLNSARIDSDDLKGIAWLTASNWLPTFAKLQRPPTAQYTDPARPVTPPACLIESKRAEFDVVDERRRVENAAFAITARGFGDNSGGFRTTVQAQLRPPPL